MTTTAATAKASNNIVIIFGIFTAPIRLSWKHVRLIR